MRDTQVRLDAQPLCPRHHVKMKLAELVLQMLTDVNSKICYRCPDPSCEYHYHIWQGYFMTRLGQHIQTDLKLSRQCPRDGNRMYIAKAGRGETRWQCGAQGCDYGETVATTAN